MGGPRRFRATVEYDGTDFAGFQVQPGARTVQGELEAALARLSGGIRQPVMGAGRTDAGVHATGQVIAFTYPGRLSAAALTEALNGMLPPDVAISGLRRAPPGSTPLRGAVPGVPLHHLERTAQPASGANDALGAGRSWTSPRWRKPRRPSRVATTSARSVEPIRSRSGPCIGSGSGEQIDGHDRRPSRRLPARHGPTDRRDPAGGGEG